MVQIHSRDSTPRRDPIPFGALRIEAFVETRQVKEFDCGNDDLNSFLCSEEVSKYESQGLGHTYLVYYQNDGCLVAYFTISADALRVEYLKSVKSFKPLSEIKAETIPSVKIGRLAVQKEYQHSRIGSYILNYIGHVALSTPFAARLLIVQAKPQSVAFYEKLGFELTNETGRERNRHNRTMFFDLSNLPRIARQI